MYKRILLPADGSDLSERAVLAGIGLARAAIVDAARRKVCDPIVMAAHGRRGLEGLLLGSDTRKVLVHGSIPALVLR